MRADALRLANGAVVVISASIHRTDYLTVDEARKLAHEISRAAALAEAMNRQRERELQT